jgi:sulfotransferase
MNFDNGFVGQPWCTLREAWFGENASRLIIVQYEKLVREPKAVLARLYAELGEPPVAHDFENVSKL